MIQTATWELLFNAISKGEKAILLFVLESSGSSPGRSGFCAAISESGEMAGSIGGGIMEYKFVEMARALLKEDETEMLVRKQFHHKEQGKDQSGAICSGEMTLLLHPVQAIELPVITEIYQACVSGIRKHIHITHDGLSLVNSEIQSPPGSLSKAGVLWSGVIGPEPTVHIIGGGHCSLALSQLLRQLGFYVLVYENRAGLNTLQDNQYAHEKIIVEDYLQLRETIHVQKEDYVVVMSFGYRTDELILRSLHGLLCKYFGVLGSQAKNKQMFEKLMSEGISKNWLNTLKSPIGLPIRSQTPMEIAVSIAAEIIAKKNKDKP